MSNSRRVFYVIYPDDYHRQQILDAIRYLADPTEKTRAHVTLRGPYPQKRSVSTASQVVKGSDVEVTGVDAFLGPYQNTVFFCVSAPGLEKVWHKPDYPTYRPHLTIYDGKSRTFAEHLRFKLQQIEPRFRFKASPLSPLITTKGQGSLELRAAYDQGLVKRLTGRSITTDQVPYLPPEERIELIAKLCSELNKEAAENGSHESGSTS
jgi:2'-5' RNA ligase